MRDELIHSLFCFPTGPSGCFSSEQLDGVFNSAIFLKPYRMKRIADYFIGYNARASGPSIWGDIMKVAMRFAPSQGVRLLFLCMLMLGAAVTGAQEASQQEVLTNDAVVKMVQAHLSSDVILEQIRNSPGSYSLTANSLIKLKQQGVPEKVILAMQAKAKPAPSNLTNSAAQSNGAPVSTPSPDKPPQHEDRRTPAGSWRVSDVTDRMTGNSHVEAVMWQPTVGTKGALTVTATCDASYLLFSISLFAPLDDPKMGFKQNSYGDSVIPGGLIGAVVMATRHSKPWVEMRVKIDDNPPAQVSSEKDFKNYAAIMFYTPSAPTDGGTAILSMFANAKSAGTVEQAVRAHTILVELTLDDDSKEILEIHPQDPAFKAYVAKCPISAAATSANPSAAAPTSGLRDTGTRDASGNPIVTYPGDTRMIDSHGNLYEPGPTHSTNGFIFGTAATRESRKYNGTVDGFATALPGIVQSAAAASGMPGQNYEKEVAFIADAVRTCAGITPQMAAGIQYYGMENVAKLGDPYKVCFGMQNVSNKVGADDRARGLAMNISPRGRWRDGQGLTVSVLFTQAPGDTAVNMHNLFDAYGIVSASINSSQSGTGMPVQSGVGNTAPSTHDVLAETASIESDEHILRLTQANPSQSRTTTITAPGRGQQIYNLFRIDARDFANGGTLVVDIDISRSSATDGSFDLFPGDVTVPAGGALKGSLAGRYDVRKGSSTRLEYRFGRGQMFALNLEGNWFSQKGATGQVQFRATVKAAQGGRLEPSTTPGAHGAVRTDAAVQVEARLAVPDSPTNSAAQGIFTPVSTSTLDRPLQDEGRRTPAGGRKVSDVANGPFNSMGFAVHAVDNHNGWTGTATITKDNCSTSLIDNSLHSITLQEKNNDTGAGRTIRAEMGADGQMHATFIGERSTSGQSTSFHVKDLSAGEMQAKARLIAEADNEANTTLADFKKNPGTVAAGPADETSGAMTVTMSANGKTYSSTVNSKGELLGGEGEDQGSVVPDKVLGKAPDGSPTVSFVVYAGAATKGYEVTVGKDGKPTHIKEDTLYPGGEVTSESTVDAKGNVHLGRVTQQQEGQPVKIYDADTTDSGGIALRQQVQTSAEHALKDPRVPSLPESK